MTTNYEEPNSARYSGMYQWAPQTDQPILIVNPMHIINLSSHTKSKLVRFFEIFKSFTEKWFSHILLLLFLVLYCCLGAWMFLMLEGANETAAKDPVIKEMESIVSEMSEQVYFRRMTIGPFRETLVIRLRDLEKSVHEMIQKGQNTQSDTKTWTFVNALFYCATIFTTIGYGTICPITPWGKVATILYSIIGIPLTLMVLTDFGKLFTRMIKRFFKFCRKIFMAKKLKKVRQVGRRATAVPGQFMTVAWDSVNKRFTTVDVPKEDNNNANNVDVENNRYSTGYKSPMFLAPPTNTHQMGPKTPVVVTGPKSPIVVTSPTPPMTAYVETRPGTPNDTIPAASYDDEDEFNLPVSLALLMLLIYMLLGSLIFMKTDKWSILDSFYFVFISMSTIGLGDLTPQNSLVMIIASIYLLFGLALTSMCINVVQEKLSESFHRAKIRIAGNMGLDVQQIMAREGSEQPPDKREKSVERREKSVDKSDKKKEKESDKKDDKNVGFTLQDNNIGKSLKDRREKREKSTDTDTSSRKGT